VCVCVCPIITTTTPFPSRCTMSYVVEYAKYVHSTFRAPKNFCHDLQNVMRGAVKNLSQTCLLTQQPEQVARYQMIFTSLQAIIDASTTTSECTVEQSDTITVESTADYLTAASTTDSLVGQHRANLSASSYKSSEAAREQTFESFNAVGAKYLSAVLTPETISQLSEVYNTAMIIQKKEGELRELEPKVKKYAKHKKMAKLEEAQRTEEALNVELARQKGALEDAMNACFPAAYTRILREYVDLCNSLLHATQVGAEIIERGAAGSGTSTAAAGVGAAAESPGGTAAATTAGHHSDGVAPTIDASEAHDVLEGVKQELKLSQGKDKMAEQKLHDKKDLLTAPPIPAFPSTSKKDTPLGVSKKTKSSTKQDATVPSTPARTGADASVQPNIATASTVAPPAAIPHAVSSKDAQQQSTSENISSSCSSGSSTKNGNDRTESLSSVSVPAPTPKADEDVSQDVQRHSSPTKLSEQGNRKEITTATAVTPSSHAEGSVAPSLAGVVHAHFPFWFRYYYFDRLANSTERLMIAFVLYVSYCKRLARKSGYTIPLPIKKHMDRVEMEFTTARYARQKREFQAVLKKIFNYRKSLEVMETYARLAREAEIHVNKHAGTKNTKAHKKWSARLKKANDSIEQLRVEVFDRGVDDMIHFYDQLLQCIRGALSDLIVTLGGNPS
jgi:hypothetical protein